MPTPALSLDDLPGLLACVPELQERVARQEREIARLRRRLAERDPLREWYELTAFVGEFGQLFSGLRAPRKRLERQCAERFANGLERAVKMVDGRLYINAGRYADWIDAGGR